MAIATGALLALRHALRNVDYDQVFSVIRDTDFSVIALALMLVTASYGSITLYDWLALHTMGRKDVPYRIAALASFTSYPIAHGIGAVALISPVIRYRIYSDNGVGANRHCEYLLSHRADLLARQYDGARLQPAL